MSTAMPILETERLLVRPFAPNDLEACWRLLDLEAWQTGQTLDQRRRWLDWTLLNYDILAEMDQPPYGDRAVVLKATSELVGAVGVVPSLAPFDQLTAPVDGDEAGFFQPEVGLFWATRDTHLRKGYATEAARAVIDFLFGEMNLRRVVATTEQDNVASQAVMRKLGMTVYVNPRSEPAWFEVAGILPNPKLTNVPANP